MAVCTTCWELSIGRNSIFHIQTRYSLACSRIMSSDIHVEASRTEVLSTQHCVGHSTVCLDKYSAPGALFDQVAPWKTCHDRVRKLHVMLTSLVTVLRGPWNSCTRQSGRGVALHRLSPAADLVGPSKGRGVHQLFRKVGFRSHSTEDEPASLDFPSYSCFARATVCLGLSSVECGMACWASTWEELQALTDSDFLLSCSHFPSWCIRVIWHA